MQREKRMTDNEKEIYNKAISDVIESAKKKVMD